jgi:hypothetical protein
VSTSSEIDHFYTSLDAYVFSNQDTIETPLFGSSPLVQFKDQAREITFDDVHQTWATWVKFLYFCAKIEEEMSVLFNEVGYCFHGLL